MTVALDLVARGHQDDRDTELARADRVRVHEPLDRRAEREKLAALTDVDGVRVERHAARRFPRVVPRVGTSRPCPRSCEIRSAVSMRRLTRSSRLSPRTCGTRPATEIAATGLPSPRWPKTAAPSAATPGVTSSSEMTWPRSRDS